MSDPKFPMPEARQLPDDLTSGHGLRLPVMGRKFDPSTTLTEALVYVLLIFIARGSLTILRQCHIPADCKAVYHNK